MQNFMPRRAFARLPDAQERKNVCTGMRRLYAPVVDGSFDALLRDIAGATADVRPSGRRNSRA
jgi:hypothetical protein